jgi:molybdopterin synthase catalytic subunit
MTESDKVKLHSKQGVTFDELVEKFRQHPRFREVGAIITFTGIVKGVARDGKDLSAIEIEPSDKTLSNLKTLCEEYEKKPGVLEVQYHLNTGELDISDPIMHIALDTTVDGPDMQSMFQNLFEILDKAKKVTGMKVKERNKEGWYYTKPKDETKSFD